MNHLLVVCRGDFCCLRYRHALLPGNMAPPGGNLAFNYVRFKCMIVE